MACQLRLLTGSMLKVSRAQYANVVCIKYQYVQHLPVHTLYLKHSVEYDVKIQVDLNDILFPLSAINFNQPINVN